MTIERDLTRIADALEKLVLPTQTTSPAITPNQVPLTTAANDEDKQPDPPVAAAGDEQTADYDKEELKKAIAQLVSDEANVPKAKEILAEFHGAEKISDLQPEEYAAVAAKINAYFFTLS